MYSDAAGSFRAGAVVPVDTPSEEKASLILPLPLNAERRRRRWASADLTLSSIPFPYPAKRAAHILSRRPLLALIALGTCMASVGMYLLGVGSDMYIDTADLSTWIYPELGFTGNDTNPLSDNSTLYSGNGSDYRIHQLNVSFADYGWDLENSQAQVVEEEEEEFIDDEWLDNPAIPAPIRAHRALEGECLEAWVARGELCTGPGFERLVESMAYAIPLDAVWTWVNGR